ncbi:MAG: patatin-like phospholipase family protein [Kouleothrix sp.]
MIAFVLSGGGNRGALQAGALQALLERGIVPDLIVGTSVGALNSVVLAADPTAAAARRQAEGWAHIRRSDVFPGNTLTVGWRILTGQGSFHSRESFARFVLATLPPNVRRFKDLEVPCLVTATALASGRLRLFGDDPNERLLDALLASTAIPPFYAPYPYRNELLLDGALVANLPLSHAIARGARTIYTLEIIDDMATSGRPGLIYTLTSSLNAMLNRQHEQERHTVALAHARGITIHDIRLTSGQNLVYNDFSRSAALVAAGERAALEYLDALPAARPAPLARLTESLRMAIRTAAAARRTAAPPSAPLPPATAG